MRQNTTPKDAPKYLKNVIKVFLETIFLKLLESSNTSYHHKHLILTVFEKIS